MALLRKLFWILLFSFLLWFSVQVNLLWFVTPANAEETCTIKNLTSKVGNSTLSYSQVGKGQTIMLLHGLFASKEQWNSILCNLSKAGYRAIAPDLPGYGNSKGFMINDYALENQAALLHELTSALKIDSLEIAGNSMGGTIAYLYAQSYPKQVHSLAFIGSPMGIVDWGEGVREAILQGINPFIPITKEQFKLEMSLLFVKPPTLPDDYVSKKVKDYITYNQRYQQIWNIVNLYDDILWKGQITRMPTLIIWGQKDKIFPVGAAHQQQQHIPGSQLILLPKAGHLPHLENADEVTSQYLQFLQSITKSTPNFSPLNLGEY